FAAARASFRTMASTAGPEIPKLTTTMRLYRSAWSTDTGKPVATRGVGVAGLAPGLWVVAGGWTIRAARAAAETSPARGPRPTTKTTAARPVRTSAPTSAVSRFGGVRVMLTGRVSAVGAEGGDEKRRGFARLFSTFPTRTLRAGQVVLVRGARRPRTGDAPRMGACGVGEEVRGCACRDDGKRCRDAGVDGREGSLRHAGVRAVVGVVGLCRRQRRAEVRLHRV